MSPEPLARLDPSPDRLFYAQPRFVTPGGSAPYSRRCASTHPRSTGAIAAVGDLYAELGLEDAESVLDLCSSWISHFRRAPERLVGLGMNAQELAANEQLAEHVVQDLNDEPRLPFADASFDGATCCVSIDYLVRPAEVVGEVARVLRPGAPFAVTFSNRCFPTKAVIPWLEADDGGHVAYVEDLFAAEPGFEAPRSELRRAGPGDPLYAVWARRTPNG